MKIGFGHAPASVVASIAAVLLPAAAAARQPPDEARTIEIHAAASDFDGQEPTIAVDGWNTTAAEEQAGGVTIEPNRDAEPDLQPATGFNVAKTGLR